MKKIIYYLVFFFICFNTNNFAQAVKIVAFVNEGVVTDFDVEEFEKILCVFDKRFKCGSQESKQMSMLGLIESTLKLEHFKQIDFGAEKNNILKGFEEYKKQVLKNIKKNEKNTPRSFIDYLYSEYLWNIMISSQIKNENITKDEIKKFAQENKLEIKDLEKLKNIYIQYKMNEISQKTMSELKKFYLVDIKGF